MFVKMDSDGELTELKKKRQKTMGFTEIPDNHPKLLEYTQNYRSTEPDAEVKALIRIQESRAIAPLMDLALGRNQESAQALLTVIDARVGALREKLPGKINQ